MNEPRVGPKGTGLVDGRVRAGLGDGNGKYKDLKTNKVPKSWQLSPRKNRLADHRVRMGPEDGTRI